MEELDLKELFTIFWNKRLEIILITLVAMAVGVVYSYFFVTPQYKASTTLVLAQASSSTGNNNEGAITQTDITLNSKLVSTYSELVKTKSVTRQVIQNLGIDMKESELEKSISIKLKNDSEFIEITVVNENAEYAALIANEVTKVFTEKVSEIYNISNISVVDKAEAPSGPYNINHTKDVAIFTFIGLVVSAVYALLANMLDTTIKTTEDIEKRTKLKVLAEIPLYEANIAVKKGGKK